MKHYFHSKLFEIIYRMAIHEGNANQRLASEAPKILFQLAPNKRIVPDQYKDNFTKLITLVENTLKDSEGRIPIKIKGIQNRTAAKYIKLLIDIEESIRSYSNNE
jgi:hypothetical protein